MTFAVMPSIMCAVVGLFVGTLLHDPVKRMAARQRISIVRPHCQHCGQAMTKVQRIPWLARLGRNQCNNCDNKLWSSFPGLELFTAATFGVIGGRVGWDWDLGPMLVLGAALVALFVIDKRSYILPNRIVYPALVVCTLLFAAAGVLGSDMDRFGAALIAAIVSWVFFVIVWLINPRGIGFGDVRLVALLGLAAGWVGLGNALLAMFLGLLLGAAGGLVMVVAQRAGMRDPIPFGPFLITGAFIATFFGESFAFLLT